MANRFGDYLKQARLAARLQTQQAAAEKITDLGRKVSQGLIAQYESGKIADPDPGILHFLAIAYDCDYLSLALQLFREKYVIEGARSKPGPEVDSEFFNLCEAARTPFSEIGGVRDLEAAQLRAKAAFVREMEVLDVGGIAQWEKNFPDLEEMWVVASNFLDDKNTEIREAVISNLKRDVHYRHYVRKFDMANNGRWTLLKRSLPRFDSELNERKIENLMGAVAIDEDDLTWDNTDLIIANPTSKNAVGFSTVRRNNQAIYAIRIDPPDLDTIIGRLSGYRTEVFKGNLFRDSRLGEK